MEPTAKDVVVYDSSFASFYITVGTYFHFVVLSLHQLYLPEVDQEMIQTEP